MGNWLMGLPVVWMTAIILAVTYAITAAIYVVVTHLADGERARAFKAISPGMLPPLAVMFALLVGFLAAQAWSDGERAHTAVNREASALRGVVLLASDFPDAREERLRSLVRQHIEDAVASEWPAMARGDATLTIMPAALQEALQLALTLDPVGPGQATAQRELVSSLQAALDARRQRIILSESSTNWVKWAALLAQAILTLVTIALVHSDNRLGNRLILAIFATAAGVAFVLIAAHSHPFAGEVGVTPSVLLQVMPEVSGTAPSG
jgi:hypothetical protein